ncbi:MAG: lipoprotein 17-related variable surface protein [Mycoplasmoidaceae bacterium]
MKIMKNKKKLSRNIILSGLALTTITGILALSIDSFGSQPLASVEHNINKSKSTRALPPTGTQTRITAIPAGTRSYNAYPFQLSTSGGETGFGNIFDFIQVTGSANPTDPEVTTTFGTPTLTGVIGTGTNSGIYTITVTIQPYYLASGVLSNQPLVQTVSVNDLMSLTAATTLRQIANPSKQDTYASDEIQPGEDNQYLAARKYVGMQNPIVSDNRNPNRSQFDSVLRITGVRADNLRGTLLINYSILNWVSSGGGSGAAGTYEEGESKAQNASITIEGFKTVSGPTTLSPNEAISKITIPSDIVGETFTNANQWNQYFRLSNPLTARDADNTALTRIKQVKVVQANDAEGTVEVELIVTGGYVNDNNLPIEQSVDATIFRTVGGFKTNIVVEQDLTAVYIGIGGGVFGLIVIIVVVVLIMNQKKKNEAIKKRKSMEARLSQVGPGGIPKAGAPAAGAGMAPGMAPGKGGPGAGPGKYVPPTISIPKSNAPSAKRPSGPLPIKK